MRNLRCNTAEHALTRTRFINKIFKRYPLLKFNKLIKYNNINSNSRRYEPRFLFGQPAAAPESVAPVAASAELTQEELRAARLADIARRRKEQQQQQQSPSENGGGGIKNKYSRKKYNSKKSKIRRHYSKKK